MAAAASCPRDGPPPAGFTYWKGPVPTPLGTWAVACLHQESQVPYGFVWTTEYQGRQIAARKDHHTWTYRGGHLVTGICIPGITLYRPMVRGEETLPVVDPTVPDPELAFYNDGPGTDWGLVALTGGSVIGVAILFAAALRFAGKRAG